MGRFGQSNMNRTLDFCPGPDRKETNVYAKGRNFNRVSTPSNPAIRFFCNCNLILTFDGTHRFIQWDFNFVSTVFTLVCTLDTHHLLFCFVLSAHVQQPTFISLTQLTKRLSRLSWHFGSVLLFLTWEILTANKESFLFWVYQCENHC